MNFVYDFVDEVSKGVVKYSDDAEEIVKGVGEGAALGGTAGVWGGPQGIAIGAGVGGVIIGGSKAIKVIKKN